jgi:hypothetical protein
MQSRTTAFVKLISFGVGMLQVSATLAECAPADMQGVWQIYSINSDGEVIQCRVAIGPMGSMSNGDCLIYFSSRAEAAVLSSGRIILSSSKTCTYKGSFELNGTVNTLRHVTLSSAKNEGQGIGTYLGGSFMLNISKL